jgi:excisionase family DNA binding protein
MIRRESLIAFLNASRRDFIVQELVTPKQVARAIDVSESSVKRWCDRGIIPSVKTAGGHRRIPIAAVISYLRETKQPLVAPEVLGLPATSGQSRWVQDRALDVILQALTAGDADRSRQILFDLWLSGKPLAVIFDEVVAPAFARIGQQWACGELEIYRERQACEIMTRVLFEFRLGTPPGDPGLLALGGTIPGDHYVIPTTMVELVLQSAGWNARSLGNSVPFSSFCRAISENRPRLFWLSISHVESPDEILPGVSSLHAAIKEVGGFLVLGGNGVPLEVREQLPMDHFCSSMQQLVRFADSLKPS